MYFDVDVRIELPESHLQNAIAFAAQYIARRRGRVIAISKDVLLFSAPFWRVYGLLYFFVAQLPPGISHGVLEVAGEGGKSAVRARISLLWLRICLAAIVVLPLIALLSGTGGREAVLGIVALGGIVVGGIIYGVAVIETSRYFRKMLLEGGTTRPSESNR